MGTEGRNSKQCGPLSSPSPQFSQALCLRRRAQQFLHVRTHVSRTLYRHRATSIPRASAIHHPSSPASAAVSLRAATLLINRPRSLTRIQSAILLVLHRFCPSPQAAPPIRQPLRQVAAPVAPVSPVSLAAPPRLRPRFPLP